MINHKIDCNYELGNKNGIILTAWNHFDWLKIGKSETFVPENIFSEKLSKYIFSKIVKMTPTIDDG